MQTVTLARLCMDDLPEDEKGKSIDDESSVYWTLHTMSHISQEDEGGYPFIIKLDSLEGWIKDVESDAEKFPDSVPSTLEPIKKIVGDLRNSGYKAALFVPDGEKEDY